MMLLICICWILLIANAPWWVWTCFLLHIIFSFISWLFGRDPKKIEDYINKFKN